MTVSTTSTARGCGRMVLIVAYPTPQQTREAAAAGNPEAQKDLATANQVEERWKRTEELALKSTDQLPEIESDGEMIELRLDVVESEQNEFWFSFTHGEREIWRELAVFESVPRYSELLALLRQRYAPRQVSVEITGRAETWLLGDRSWIIPK